MITVRNESRDGTCEGRGDRGCAGVDVIFLPMHFGEKADGTRRTSMRLARANIIVSSPRIDPVSKEPDLKLAAVQVEKFVPAKRRIVIIGAGAAAFGFIGQHRQFNGVDEIVLLGGEDLLGLQPACNCRGTLRRVAGMIRGVHWCGRIGRRSGRRAWCFTPTRWSRGLTARRAAGF